jgi:glycosyltransferase involved in cell wall biosynthesis
MECSQIRSLFITKEVPYPPRGGVSLRNWQNMNILRQYGPVAVFSAANWTPKVTTLPNIEIWRHCNAQEQRSSWENFQRRLWWLFPLRHPNADWAYSANSAGELQQLIADFKPDLVIFEEVWLYRYLKALKDYPVHLILDQHNVEFHLFQQGIEAGKNWPSRLKNQLLLSHLKNLEGEFCRQVDSVWTCSENDIQLLEEIYGKIAPSQVIPNGLDIDYYSTVRFNQANLLDSWQANPHTLIFIGLLSYTPNTEAAELLLQQVYPRLQASYPDCRLLLVGRNPTVKMQEIAAKEPGIILTGGVADVRPYLAAASVVAVPLRQGGGTRLKILEAFAAGRPVVSTVKGVEGLRVKDGEQLLIRESAEAIAAGVSQIWSDAALSQKLSNSAYELVKKEYSWDAVGRRIEPVVQQYKKRQKAKGKRQKIFGN